MRVTSQAAADAAIESFWTWYSRLVARYPVVILVGVSLLSLAALICSITLHSWPDFTDPQAGFETRGTAISNRLTAWENLLDSVSHVGPLTTNPLEASALKITPQTSKVIARRNRKNRNKTGAKSDTSAGSNQDIAGSMHLEEGPSFNFQRTETSTQHRKEDVLQGMRNRRHLYDDVAAAPAASAARPAEPILLHPALQEIAWMCGEPMPEYAHVVFATDGENDNLFSYESIISMCAVEATRLRSPPDFQHLCENRGPARCCPGWSLGGYISLLHDRSSCFSIKRNDVYHTKMLLRRCAPFYHSGELTAGCLSRPEAAAAAAISSSRQCVRVPRECIKHNIVYNLLHYILDGQYLPKHGNGTKKLNYAMSFLPLARSSATLDYYHTLRRDSMLYNGDDWKRGAGDPETPLIISDGKTQVVAMDLGLKDALFNEYLVEDGSSHLLLAFVLIALTILVYTRSFFITFAAICAIFYALTLAYFIYTFLFRIAFFPFMNVLAAVIAIGVGADDTFILVKAWAIHLPAVAPAPVGGRTHSDRQRGEQNDDVTPAGSGSDADDTLSDKQLAKLVKLSLRHSVTTMLVTSVTTTAAFFASLISNVTAIRCFSVFAGSAIVCNFLLMVTWTPAALVFYQKFFATNNCLLSCFCFNCHPPMDKLQQGLVDKVTDYFKSLFCCIRETNAAAAANHYNNHYAVKDPMAMMSPPPNNGGGGGGGAMADPMTLHHPHHSSAFHTADPMTANNAYHAGSAAQGAPAALQGDPMRVVYLAPPPMVRPASSSTMTTSLGVECLLATIQNKWARGRRFWRWLKRNLVDLAVIRPKYAWLLGLGSLSMASLVAVVHWPGLRLPDRQAFQLFRSSHTFEKYDLTFRPRFGFERSEQQQLSFKMPLRFVWGVLPRDNGDFLDPGNKGQMVPDPDFDVASLGAQRWMLRFCHQLTKQPFFLVTETLGPLQLSNCFMETFKDWMDKRCVDELGGEDYRPCCEASQFPFERDVFDQCLTLAIGDLYQTPLDFWRPGVAGPKFNLTTGKVEAVIVEFDSNVTFSFDHRTMQAFHRQVEAFFQASLETAPKGLKRGFFVSHLGFHDVQTSLLNDTFSAMALALLAAICILAAFTRSPAVTASAAATVCSVILVTTAILVTLFDWRLNILESVAITLAIGLSVDFSLHYAVTYQSSTAFFETTSDYDEDEARIRRTIRTMALPVTMAAFTTFLAGACLLPTRVLAYIQIGTFIVILMTVSWAYSTFFLHALLQVFAPIKICDKEEVSDTDSSLDAASVKNRPETPAPPLPEEAGSVKDGGMAAATEVDAPVPKSKRQSLQPPPPPSNGDVIRDISLTFPKRSKKGHSLCSSSNESGLNRESGKLVTVSNKYNESSSIANVHAVNNSGGSNDCVGGGGGGGGHSSSMSLHYQLLYENAIVHRPMENNHQHHHHQAATPAAAAQWRMQPYTADAISIGGVNARRLQEEEEAIANECAAAAAAAANNVFNNKAGHRRLCKRGFSFDDQVMNAQNLETSINGGVSGNCSSNHHRKHRQPQRQQMAPQPPPPHHHPPPSLPPKPESLAVLRQPPASAQNHRRRNGRPKVIQISSPYDDDNGKDLGCEEENTRTESVSRPRSSASLLINTRSLTTATSYGGGVGDRSQVNGCGGRERMSLTATPRSQCSSAIAAAAAPQTFFSPMHHEEIVTVVDNCHSDLILRPRPEASNKTDEAFSLPLSLKRRSLSSSGLGGCISGGGAGLDGGSGSESGGRRSWFQRRRQNSFETVINLGHDNMIINDTNGLDAQQQQQQQQLPKSGRNRRQRRLASSNGALTSSSSCANNPAQLAATSDSSCLHKSRSMHQQQQERQHERSGYGGGGGGSTDRRCQRRRRQPGLDNESGRALQNTPLRHPLSHSQETILYTDDGYDPQPILPNRQPGTPDVWVPINRTIRA